MTEVTGAFDWLARRITTPREVSMEVIKRICAERRVDVRLVMSKSRSRPAFLARREIIIELRSRGMSYPRIGRLLQRDHTTVMNCIGALPNKLHKYKTADGQVKIYQAEKRYD